MTTKELQLAVHQNAKTKGFWDVDANSGEKIALIHSELSELLETHRVEPRALFNTTRPSMHGRRF